jgi:homoserine O-succinyltransferase/O-acetyltransferase
MPVLLDTTQAGPANEGHLANCVTVGLVNNMPDAALQATERQFTDLIRAAAHDTVVRLLLFRIPEVPRGEAARRDMAGRYRDIAELSDARLDGLIVTGTEPRAKDLKAEPYWAALAGLIDWAREHTTSTIWSCLAAHAAVLQSDGIGRCALAGKLSGVFDCEPATAHPMLRGVSLPLRVPHSRGNDLPERALKAAGYRILTRSAAAGVDMFARQERSFHLFLQGHPEYAADALLREYRRDIGRYLRGERADYPAMPLGYFGSDATDRIVAFRKRVMANHTVDRRGELLRSFPLRALEAGLKNDWQHAAIAIYENWFGYLKGRKAERRPATTPMRRAWRDWPVSHAHRATESSAL